MRLGEHNLLDETEQILEVKVMVVKQIIVHNKYNPITFENDIAILELPEEVDLTEYTPACMAKADDDMTYADKMAWAYGEIIKSENISPSCLL